MTADAAVTGGSGLVGGDLVRQLAAGGQRVVGIVRSESAARKVAELGADPIVVDLFDEDGLRDALWGIPLVYHVAGVNETCTRDPAGMDRVNVDGTVSVIRAASDAGVGRIVYTSSAAAIGEREGTIGHEEIVHSGEYLSPYARSKHRAEVAAFETAEDSGVDLVAVNPSSVQGPGRSGGSAKILLYGLRSGRPRLFDTHVSIVDIRDCSAGHIAAAARGRPGQRYLLSGATITVKQAIQIAGDVADVTIDPRWLSEGVVRTLGRPAARVVSWVRPDAGICPALIDTLIHGHRFDGSKAERDLGISYTPIEETFERTIDWFREQGLVPASDPPSPGATEH